MKLTKFSQALEGIDLALSDDLFVMEDVPMLDPGEVGMAEDGDLNMDADKKFELLEVEVPHLSLSLDKIPGSSDQDFEPVLEVEEPEEIEVDENDHWKYTLESFIPWLHKMMKNVPSHSGKEVLGCRRAVSYLKALDREIDRVAQMDINGEIPIDILENAKDEVWKGVERLEERIEKLEGSKRPKKKKKAEMEYELTKEAGVSNTGHVVITVPLLISSLARSCVNSMVSAGKDIERTFTKLCEEYNLDKRERLELMQLLDDSGFSVRRDLGMPLDKPIDTTSVDNVNWMANYPA